MNGRKLISILLALVMTLILLPVVSAHADEVVEIGNYEQLKAFAERVNAGEYGLNAKVISDFTCPSKENWTPICPDKDHPYTGTFDGNNSVITGLKCTQSKLIDEGPVYVYRFGLFGVIGEGGTVQDLYLKDCSMKATVKETISVEVCLGVIAGENFGTVANCCVFGTSTVNGSVDLPTPNVGGIAGRNSGSGMITKSCYSGEIFVTASDSNAVVYVGGIVGYNYNQLIENCFHTGSVHADTPGGAFVGGVAGFNDAEIRNCRHIGSVEGNNGTEIDIGGVCGINTIFGTLENCYARGALNSTGADGNLFLGAVAGMNNRKDGVTNCCYDTTLAQDVEPVNNSDSGSYSDVVGLTSEQFADKSNFIGWEDFDTNWGMDDEQPELLALSAPVTLYANSGEDVAILRNIPVCTSVTIANPFTYDGYVFTGWNTKADADGDPYSETDAFMFLRGETLSLHAQWREVVNYPLWVGGVQVTSENMDDVLGDGTVKFEITEDGENVLTLTNANITGTSGDLDGLPTNIFSSENNYALTVRAVGENSLRGGNYAIQNNQGALTFVGSGKLTAEGTLTGILAPMGITFDGPAVNVKGWYFGVWTVGTLTLKSKLIAEGTNQLAVLADTITLGEGMAITSPAGGYIAVYDTEKTIYTSDGVEATEVVIEEAYTFAFDEADVQFRGETPYVIADGTAKEPGFTVTDSAGNAIDPAEYEVEYLENTAPGTAYVVVTFQNGHEPVRAFFKIYLPASESLAVENVESGILLSWEPVEGAAGYVIYRRAWGVKTRGGWTSFERWNNTTETEWIDTEVYAGTRYQYGVKAYFEKRTDPVSGEEIGGNENVPLGNWNLGVVSPLMTTVRLTTRTLTSATGGTKKMTLKWTGSQYCTGYQIKYATDESFTRGVRALKIADPAVYQTVVEGLRSNTTYYVTVRSYSEFGGMTYFGEWSNVKSCTVK